MNPSLRMPKGFSKVRKSLINPQEINMISFNSHSKVYQLTLRDRGEATKRLKMIFKAETVRFST